MHREGRCAIILQQSDCYRLTAHTQRDVESDCNRLTAPQNVLSLFAGLHE